MFLSHLHLKNFRNYEELTISFDQQINIFQGNNAQGKTNILEAIYLLALAKSHRTSKEKELVQWGHSFSVVKGNLESKNRTVKLEVQLSNIGKKVKINQLEKRKLSEYIGACNIVMFGPEDLNLVKGSPQHRRKFLDIEIGQVSPSYIYNLSQYQKIVQQRNNLLKDFTIENKNKLELLEVWNMQLIKYGTKVIFKRLQFLNKLEKWANEIHSGITYNKESLSILYKSSFPIDKSVRNEQEILDYYQSNVVRISKQELNRGMTLIGPHRDDLEFYINDIDVQIYGSQGQQRTTALSLKLAELELINDEVGEYPILLLDDVLSELDKQRQTQLIQTIENKVQTMITTTSTEGIDFNNLTQSTVYYVENGLIRSKN